MVHNFRRQLSQLTVKPGLTKKERALLGTVASAKL